MPQQGCNYFSATHNYSLLSLRWQLLPISVATIVGPFMTPNTPSVHRCISNSNIFKNHNRIQCHYQYCVFAKIVLLITQEIANVNNDVILLAKNIICGLKREVDFSDFYHVDIFAYHRFKLASGEGQISNKINRFAKENTSFPQLLSTDDQHTKTSNGNEMWRCII